MPEYGEVAMEGTLADDQNTLTLTHHDIPTILGISSINTNQLAIKHLGLSDSYLPSLQAFCFKANDPNVYVRVRV